MKILQVLPTLGNGGAEHCSVELTKELIKQGYTCDMLTLFDIDNDADLAKELMFITNITSLHKNSGLDISCFNKLYRFIKNGGYDVVHVHVGAIPYLFLSAILLKKVKYVATIHSEAKREAGNYLNKWVRFFMFKRGLCTPVTISEESKVSFDNYYNMNAPMVYNGVSDYSPVEIPELRDNENQLLFIHVANCRPIKNQQLLLKGFSKLKEDYPNIKLLWLGSNKAGLSLFDSLQLLMPAECKYIGDVSNVRDYLAVADAMCLSSKMEGMPMTIIEAFSVGCPSLCTPVGGIINMIQNGENGMLSEDLEVESYYSMLKAFCDLTPQERQQMKENAKRSFEKYSIENSVKGYLEIYKP